MLQDISLPFLLGRYLPDGDHGHDVHVHHPDGLRAAAAPRGASPEARASLDVDSGHRSLRAHRLPLPYQPALPLPGRPADQGSSQQPRQQQLQLPFRSVQAGGHWDEHSQRGGLASLR